MSKKKTLITVTTIFLFIVLAIAIKVDWLTGFETWVYNKATQIMCKPLTVILIIITHLGGPLGVAGMYLLILLNPKLRNRLAIPVACSVCSSFVLNTVLKAMFARQRPNILRLVSETYYSFPSGHAMINMALYATLGIYAYKFIKDKKIKWSLIGIMGFFVTLVGLTRIYLGVHYAGDIIGGWLLGLSVSVIVYTMVSQSKVQ